MAIACSRCGQCAAGQKFCGACVALLPAVATLEVPERNALTALPGPPPAPSAPRPKGTKWLANFGFGTIFIGFLVNLLLLLGLGWAGGEALVVGAYSPWWLSYSIRTLACGYAWARNGNRERTGKLFLGLIFGGGIAAQIIRFLDAFGNP